MIRASKSWRSVHRAVSWLATLLLVLLLAGPGVLAHAALDMQLVVRPADGLGCTDVVVNGGFENGPADMSPWVPSGHAYVSEAGAHGGDFGLWMGGYPDALATVHQSVTVPADLSSATLTYWWNMHSLDGSEVPTDRLVVSLRTQEGQLLLELERLDNTGQRGTWAQSTFDLSSYVGMELQIHFECMGDEQRVTSFLLDDVVLEACAEDGTATPTVTPTAIVVEPLLRYLPLVLAE